MITAEKDIKIENEADPLKSVLVVEDDEGLNRLIQKSLIKAGFTIVGIFNGRDAIAHVKENPDVLLLLDLIFPDISGREVIEEITRLQLEVPFIVMTGHGDEKTAVKMMKMGARDYLIKDSGFLERLVPTVQRICSDIKIENKLASAEKSLKSAVKEWQTTFDTIKDAVCLLDLDSKIIRCNKAMQNMLGKPWKEIVGHTCCQLMHGHPGPIADCPYQRSIKSNQKEHQILSVSDRFIDVTVYPVLDNDGILSGAVHIVADITERKQAEEELRQYEHIVSSTTDMLALVDQRYIYLAANAAYLQAFAKASDEVIGRTMAEVFGEEFFNRAIRPKADRCLAGEDIRYQDWFEFPAAGRKYMDVAYSPYLGPDAEVLGFVITARDITERENLQAQLIQAQKMESVGRLAGGVAHDYNNVLSVIIGFTELTIAKVDSTSPLRANLDEVLTAAGRATDITRQLLTFARKQTIAPKVLDLNENMESMLKMLRHLIGEDIDLAWLPGKSLWPVKMDPSQIDQILANLCVNSRDAIEGVGKITIETGNVTFDETYCADHIGFVPGEFVSLTVSDSGCGMDREILDNIFEPFFTTKDVDKGTGLGLATVYGIVKQNNGFINVYSEPGKGTTIKSYLPRHEGKAVEVKGESTAKIPPGRGETVLLAEDDLALLNLTEKILDGLGYTVLSANAPGEAIGLAEKHAGEIHLLLTDVIMPEMNGRELANRLKFLNPNLKCLFMSGYTANVIAHRGILDEGVQFIQKPFSRKDLATIVRKILDEGKS